MHATPPKHEELIAQLRENEARLRAVLDTTVDAIITICDKGNINSFNKAAERMFGYSADEIIGKNVSLLMPSPHRERHDAYLHSYVDTGRAKIIGIGREELGMRKNGDTFPIELSVSESDVGGRKTFTGIVRDISERRHLEKAIVTASEGERQLIGQELHDALGQQLTGIALLVKALERKINVKDEALREEAAAVADLAQQAVMEAKRLAHGLYPTVLDRHGLATALDELADTQQRLYQIDCAFVGDDAIIDFDKTAALHLYRIAQEASNNAIKHGKPKRITIDLNREEGDIALQIADDGIGIPDDIKPADGMGLSIMSYRAKMVGGVLRIYRNEPHGTVVDCRLVAPHTSA